jgi:hypothetical protein
MGLIPIIHKSLFFTIFPPLSISLQQQ